LVLSHSVTPTTVPQLAQRTHRSCRPAPTGASILASKLVFSHRGHFEVVANAPHSFSLFQPEERAPHQGTLRLCWASGTGVSGTGGAWVLYGSSDGVTDESRTAGETGGGFNAFRPSDKDKSTASLRCISASLVANSLRRNSTSFSKRVTTSSVLCSYGVPFVASSSIKTYTRPSVSFSDASEPRLMRCLTPSEEIPKASAACFTSTRRLIVVPPCPYVRTRPTLVWTA